MPTYRITDPETGQTLKLTGDSPPTEQELEQIFASQRQAPAQPTQQPSAVDQIQRQLALTLRSGAEGLSAVPGMLAEPIRQGLMKIPGIRDLPGLDIPSTEFVPRLLTQAGVPQPETPIERIVGGASQALTGAGGIIGAGRGLAPAVSEFLTAQPGLQALAATTGGGAATGAEEAGVGPTGQMVAGVGGALVAPGVAGLGGVLGRQIPRDLQQIITAGERAGVPVRTTDVIPPETFAGRVAAQTAEKIPVIGTGAQRAGQQAARTEAVEDLAQQFDVGLDAPLERQIVASLSETQKAGMKRAGEIRNDAVNRLETFGNVPVSGATKTIDDQIAKEEKLGARANTGLIQLMQDTKSALSGDFRLIGDVRTRVIQDIKKLQRGEHEVLSSQDEAALQSIKTSIDKDMKSFAANKDRTAAAKWIQSNKLFTDEFTKFKGSELKRLLAKGDVTPEIVAPVLRGGKLSELNRLNNNLTPQGRASARSAIIRDALTKSGYPNQLNPDRLATELSKPNIQKSVGVFFKGQDKKQLDGLVALLNATRRAQQAGVATPTGQALIPLAAGGAAVADPLTTFLTAGTVSGIARAYESAPVRNLMIKLANAKPGSQKFQELVDQAAPIINATLQVTAETEALTQ